MSILRLVEHLGLGACYAKVLKMLKILEQRRT